MGKLLPMKKSSLLLVSLLFLLLVKSSAQSVSYTVLEDDPNRVKQISLSLEPFYSDFYLENATIGWSLRADALLMKRIEGRFSFNKGYFDVIQSTSDIGNLMKPESGLKDNAGMEIGGSFFLIDHNSRRPIRVVLSSHKSGNTTYTQYMNVSAHRRFMLGVRGGFRQGATNFEIESDMKNEFFAVNVNNDKDSVHFGDFGISVDGMDVYSAYTVQRQTLMYAGIDLRRVTNLVVQADGYNRKKSNRMINNFSFDYLIAPYIGFKNIHSATKTWRVETPNGIIKRTGWRVGWMLRAPNLPYLAFKGEFGSYPGIKIKTMTMKNYFINVSLGLNIPIGYKPKATPSDIAKPAPADAPAAPENK